MNEGFDAAGFAFYLKARGRSIAICCGVAVMAAALGGVVVPPRFTSTSRILIRPPAGLDPRAAMSISPVYMESLRTFEHLASSDSLFHRALHHAGLLSRYAGQSEEAVKRSVLKVSRPVNTRVMEISVTLPDPHKAQELARYLAEQTVELSRSLERDFSADLAKEAEAAEAAARARLANARKANETAAAKPGSEASAAELAADGELKIRTGEALSMARADLAELVTGVGVSRDAAGSQIAAARARVADLEEQYRRLDKAIGEAGARVESAREKQSAMDAELQSATKEFDTARNKLGEFRAAGAFRGERLDVFDPGIVPLRPSYPNTPLNIVVALVLSSVACVFWLAFRFGYERRAATRNDRAYTRR